MEYTLWVNRYFLTKVKATSMNEAIRSIKNMTSDENMFEWISVFDTPYEEGDIPILDLELYCYDKFISYDTLHDIINEYDYCYMSPLIRSVQTAIILIGDRVETIPDKRLVERNLGELEGKDRKLYAVHKYWDYKLNCNDLGVEPVQEIFKRCEDFLDYIKNKYDDDTTIMVVSHGAPIRALHHILSNSNRNGNLLDIKIPNCFYKEYELKK